MNILNERINRFQPVANFNNHFFNFEWFASNITKVFTKIVPATLFTRTLIMGKKIQYDKLLQVKGALSSFLFSFQCKNYMRPSARINCLITRYIQEYIDKNTRKYVQNTQIKSGIDEICLFICCIIKLQIIIFRLIAKYLLQI